MDEKATDAKIAELKTATREANEVLQAMLHLEKRLGQQYSDLQALLNDAFDNQIEAEVKKGLDEYGKSVKVAMDQAVAKVGQQFDDLSALYLGGMNGSMTLEEMIQRGMCTQHGIHKSLCKHMKYAHA